MLPACSDDVPHGPKINSRVKHKTDAFHNLTLFIKVYNTSMMRERERERERERD